jgi:hypothetical protein
MNTVLQPEQELKGCGGPKDLSLARMLAYLLGQEDLEVQPAFVIYGRRNQVHERQ